MVLDIREDWLVQDRWWTDAPIDRHYWELVLQPGRLVVVYRDTRSNRWFNHEPSRASIGRSRPEGPPG